MVVAGEASGDMYGAILVERLRALDPSLRFSGMGGDGMRRVGVETLVDANTMAVMGLVEVVGHLPTIVRGFKILERRILTERPKLVIFIDYPDFNLRLAKVAKRAGVKVLHFVSPTVWAWRSGRVKGIGKVVDMMAVLFPFEVPFYERANVPVSFVGHPLLDMVAPAAGRGAARSALGLDAGRTTIGLFPGSRRSVIKKLLPTVLQSAALLKERRPDLQFVLPLASSLRSEDLAPYLAAAGFPVAVVSGRNHEVMSACDAAIAVSGTVTLELALVGIPMVLIYKVAPLSYEIGKRVIKVDHIGLCNIISGKRIVRELIQHEAEPPVIAGEIERILDDRAYAETMRGELADVRVKLGSGGALDRLARVAFNMLEHKQGS
ncbi:lipid-A-disaccharide synthase [Geomonas sp. Red32]|uniref:lipid-A-disaccharide synthase n=1 Tax=Geomonas sp. Red32 TaxID=2912856 RepID=UPI00202CAE1B|nr:lipid-A-disaccharide synthase [Geomonas sp. Red32]MCM0082815.1 lipid-A-disaccharide synthase [Geomonas sp. Red32]